MGCSKTVPTSSFHLIVTQCLNTHTQTHKSAIYMTFAYVILLLTNRLFLPHQVFVDFSLKWGNISFILLLTVGWCTSSIKLTTNYFNYTQWLVLWLGPEEWQFRDSNLLAMGASIVLLKYLYNNPKQLCQVNSLNEKCSK